MSPRRSKKPPNFNKLQVTKLSTVSSAGTPHLLLSLFPLRRRYGSSSRDFCTQQNRQPRHYGAIKMLLPFFGFSLESFGRTCVCLFTRIQNHIFLWIHSMPLCLQPVWSLQAKVVAPPELAAKLVNRVTVRWDNFGRLDTLKSFPVDQPGQNSCC